MVRGWKFSKHSLKASWMCHDTWRAQSTTATSIRSSKISSREPCGACPTPLPRLFRSSTPSPSFQPRRNWGHSWNASSKQIGLFRWRRTRSDQMADVCYAELTCFEEDKGKFEGLGFRLHERLGNGCVRMHDDQADHGHCQELQGLAGEGVVFHGHSGAGADYPSMVFASDGCVYAT